MTPIQSAILQNQMVCDQELALLTDYLKSGPFNAASLNIAIQLLNEAVVGKSAETQALQACMRIGFSMAMRSLAEDLKRDMEREKEQG
jgi:hypothetical protein